MLSLDLKSAALYLYASINVLCVTICVYIRQWYISNYISFFEVIQFTNSVTLHLARSLGMWSQTKTDVMLLEVKALARGPLETALEL